MCHPEEPSDEGSGVGLRAPQILRPGAIGAQNDRETADQ